MKSFLPITFFILFLVSCSKQKPSIVIIQSKIIKELPSASGIITSKEEFYVIGDDSPFLFKVNRNSKIISKSIIHTTKHLYKGRVLKKYKPDFEALETINKNEIIVIGSGSKTPQRDIFLRVFLGSKISFKSYNITKFYNHLKNNPILDNKELNIEALAYRKGNIHLFNRGKNVIFSFNYHQLINYFEGLSEFPEPTTTLFHLPTINGIESGFSGATFLKNESVIIFTASVENTNNSYNDGEILGSFIGSISLENNIISNSYKAILIPEIKKPLKVESVAITKEISPNITKVVLVTDDDLGNSLKIDCLVKW